jgi:valyl-tRNA synthetase
VRAIRNLRAEKKVGPARRIPAVIAGGTKTGLFQQQAPVIAALAGLDPAQFAIHSSLASKPTDAITLVVGSIEVHLPLSGMVDQEEERARLARELDAAQAQIDRLEKLLASDFASKAPPAVVQKERERLAALQETARMLEAQLG